MSRFMRGLLNPHPMTSRLCLLLLALHGAWACWLTYLETRPDRMSFIQIMLPDPVVVLHMNSYIPIVLIAIGLMLFKKVSLPIAVLAYLVTPLVRYGLQMLDEIPGMFQPSPAVTFVMAPLAVLLVLVATRKRYRSLDAIAVTFSYAAITGLYLLYHVAFIFPIYHQTEASREARLGRIVQMEPDLLANEMDVLGAKEVSALTPKDIAYLNDMNDMNIDFTFPGESAQRIMSEHPAAAHYWIIVGRTFADKRALVYDGRLQGEGQEPRLWALPQEFEQEFLIITSGGFYLVVTIVAYFWTLMALFICHVHGAKVARLQPFARRKYLPAK